MMSASAQPESQETTFVSPAKTPTVEEPILQPTSESPSTSTTASTTPSTSTTPLQPTPSSQVIDAKTELQSDTTEITTAPPQPPLPPSDLPFTLPEIVHGIDPDDDAHHEESIAHSDRDRRNSTQSLTRQSSVSEVFTSLTARMNRAVRFSSDRQSLTPPRALFLFGDSLTSRANRASDPSSAPGWVCLLREVYDESLHLHVHGHSGYNTRWALHILPRSLHAAIRCGASITHATILFGSNDAAAPSSPQHVPLDEYVCNLCKMVLFVRSCSVVPILITPPPLADRSVDLSAGRTHDRVTRYARAAAELAAELNCPVVDLHTGLVQRAAEDGHALDALFNDGLHFSPLGNRLVFELILHALGAVSVDLVPANTPRPFPLWTEINPAKPADVLGMSELVDP